MSDPINVSPMSTSGGALPRPRSRTWPVIGLGLVLLVCGNVIGAGVAVLWLKAYLPPPPPPSESAVAGIVHDMQARYDLSEEQAVKVREIMQRRIDAMEAIHREAQGKAEAEREKLRGEMKTVLKPEQYAQWLAQFEAVGARRGPPGGGGGPPGAGGPGMGGRQGPGQQPPVGFPPPGQGPTGGRPGIGGGPGQGPGPGRPLPQGMGRGPGPEGGPMRPPLPPEGRRGPPGGPRPGEMEPGGPSQGGAAPGGAETPKPPEPQQ